MNLSFQVQNMLKLLKSSKTKVEISGDVKNEKYSFISDTIYISSTVKSKQKGLEDANPFCLKLVSMYKLYFSSKQANLLHFIQLMLTNISLIMFGMTILFRITLGKSRGVCILTSLVILLATGLELFMENNAYKRACAYIKKNVSKIGDEDITKENVNSVEKLVNKNKLKLIINKELYRIILFLILLLLMI